VRDPRERSHRVRADPSLQRLGYLDSLKLFLTVLVIGHHVAITYGAAGSWFYVEPTSSTAFRAIATLFTATNQFYFMGLFFFLSGYFVPGAIARKGKRRFVRDRFVRLGIPWLLFSLFVSPFLEHVASLRSDDPSRGYVDQLLRHLARFDLPPGPLWFVETLLVFSIVYAIVAPPPSARLPARIGHRHLFALAGLLAVSTFAVRLVWPAGHEWHHLQLAYFPQYIALFTLGTMAEERGWLDALHPRLLRVWIPVLVLDVIALAALIATFMPRGPGALARFVGGPTPEAAALVLLENVYCVGACVVALVVFRSRFAGTSRWARALTPEAYGTYIFHAPVIVALGLRLGPVNASPFAKFALLTVAGTIGSFAVTSVLRRSALVRRVL
jgi:glucans biosynthesis protein C